MRTPLLVLLLLVACSSPEDAQRDFTRALDAGDDATAERTLREGLEKHPDEVNLLIAAGHFYLRADPAEHYKPRLALHYAMRATKATRASDPRATDLLKRAQLAAGGIVANTDLGREVLQRGLEAVGEEQTEPVGFRPFDPDLLGGTGAEIREQLRRWKKQDSGKPLCPRNMAAIPEGKWELPELTTVGAFCVEDRLDGGLRLLEAGDVEPWCAEKERRVCTPDELSVACGPLAQVLRDHPQCADARVARCCADLAAEESSQ